MLKSVKHISVNYKNKVYYTIKIHKIPAKFSIILLYHTIKKGESPHPPSLQCFIIKNMTHPDYIQGGKLQISRKQDLQSEYLPKITVIATIGFSQCPVNNYQDIKYVKISVRLTVGGTRGVPAVWRYTIWDVPP